MAGEGEVMMMRVVVVIASSRFVRWRECCSDAALMCRMKRFLARFVTRVEFEL